jgi:alpha-tubulin suppressor-like RCC1 family protein
MNLFIDKRNSLGQLYSWGKNDKGQLGLGHSKSIEEKGPQLIEGLKGVNVAQVSCGNAHCCCVSEQGHLYSWVFIFIFSYL